MGRSIHLVRLDKTRPAVIMTRPSIWNALTRITVAPITSRVRGLFVEVAVNEDNGLDRGSVINCDNLTTIPAENIGRYLGQLSQDQENALGAAIRYAYRLEP